jgi:hypothetical protein
MAPQSPTSVAQLPIVTSWSAGLDWPGASPEQVGFMRAVYDEHAALARARGRTFTGDLPPGQLAVIYGRHRARTDAAAAARALLAAARTALTAAGRADRVVIAIISAYRPASRQFLIWQGKGRRGGFPYYYRQMLGRGTLRAGDYGPAAVRTMAHEMTKWIASPGYSNHQDGLAIDFGTGTAGRNDLAAIGAGSWFHQWLVGNAHRFGFHPYAQEAWHWTFRPGSGPGSSAAPAPPTGATPRTTAVDFSRRTPAARRWAALVPLLDSSRGEIPLDFLLGWIYVESNGLIDVITSIDERGFFQIHPDESRDRHFDHRRLTTDPNYSVRSGLQLVRSYADLARRRFPWIPPGSELFWRVVKLQHAMGSGLARKLLASMQSTGVPPTTWEAIRAYEATPAAQQLHRLLRVKPGRFSHNVDAVFTNGRRIAASLGR